MREESHPAQSCCSTKEEEKNDPMRQSSYINSETHDKEPIHFGRVRFTANYSKPKVPSPLLSYPSLSRFSFLFNSVFFVFFGLWFPSDFVIACISPSIDFAFLIIHRLVCSQKNNNSPIGLFSPNSGFKFDCVVAIGSIPFIHCRVSQLICHCSIFIF